jgi:hypothetical protein
LATLRICQTAKDLSKMSSDHRYIFEKGSKKHICPECNKRRFVRYIDTETGDYLPDQYGRCDRESKCSYHLNPYLDGYAKAIKEQEKGNRSEFPNNWKTTRKTVIPKPAPKPVFIPVEVFRRTRAGYEQNLFIQNLLTRIAFPFEVKDIEKVISFYHLGTVQNGYRAGAITFPFIDVKGNVRAIQVKQFNEANHTTGTDFLHSIIEKLHTRNNQPLPEWLEGYNKNEIKVSCLFGEHLLSKYPHNPVALVEAPKTAVYGTLYFGFPDQPQNLLWLAVYNLSSLNLTKCQALKGRNVYLFPDLSKDGKAFELWSRKAKDIQSQLPGSYFKVADFLELLAPYSDKENGNDLADYLITKDWRLFRMRNVQEQPQPKPVESPTREKSEKSVALKKTFFPQAEPTQKATNCNSFKEEKELIPEYDYKYFEKVSGFIYTTAKSITQSRVLPLEELPEAAENPAKVTECIKQLITLAGGSLIEFNSSYSKVRIYPHSG